MRQPLHLIAPLFLLTAPLPSIGAADAVSFPQIAKLKAADGAAGDGFGYTVAIGGDFAIVGADGDDDLGSSSGAAYIFERDAGGPDAWGQVAKLTAPGGGAVELFGWSVAIRGERAIVGAPADSQAVGHAYVFERGVGESEAWGAVATLVASDSAVGDNFGGSVALEGDVAVVGASGADGPGSSVNGAAYVFERDAGGPDAWGQVAKLTAAIVCEDDASYCGWRNDDFFGSSMAISGDTVVVGNSETSGGFAYIFRRQPGRVWRRLARPIPADFSGGDHYGRSVAVSGETVLVGAFGDDDLANQAGAAYVLEPEPDGPHPWAALSLSKPSPLARGTELAPEGTGALQRSLAAALAVSAEPAAADELDTEAPPLRSEAAMGRAAALAQTAIEAPEAAAPGRAQAPGETWLCLDFDNYCDALQLTVSGGTVRGVRRAPAEFFCEPFEVAISGSLAEGRVLLRCDALEDSCPVGASWGWILDLPLDGTLDMVQLDGVWNAWIDETPYTTSAGACPF